MKYVAAYMLASMGGKREPVHGDLEKILGSVGLNTSDEHMAKVINALKVCSIYTLFASFN